MEGEHSDSARAKQDLETVQAEIEHLTDPLGQAWAEANSPKTGLAFPTELSYNTRTDVPVSSGNQPTKEADSPPTLSETRDSTDEDIHIRGYFEHIVDHDGNVDASQMGRLRRGIQKGILSGKEIGAIGQKMAELGITAEYEAEMRKINFNEYLTNIVGKKPADMARPHAHHILFKTGRGKAQQKLVREAQEFLRKNGIDPIVGPENLVWAPQYAKGQHSMAALAKLVDALKAADEGGGGYDAVLEVLTTFGKIASQRK